MVESFSSRCTMHNSQWVPFIVLIGTTKGVICSGIERVCIRRRGCLSTRCSIFSSWVKRSNAKLLVFSQYIGLVSFAQTESGPTFIQPTLLAKLLRKTSSSQVADSKGKMLPSHTLNARLRNMQDLSRVCLGKVILDHCLPSLDGWLSICSEKLSISHRYL